MSDKAPHWVVPAMRAGYTARAIVYLILGILLLAAARTGREAEGTGGALEQLRGLPFGTFLLWIIGLGLFLYAIWRVICAAMDLEARGTDGEAIIARIGEVISGIVHAGLGFSAIQLALGSGTEGDDAKAESWTAAVLAMPGGRWIVGIVALIVIGAGCFYIYKGYTERFREYLMSTPRMEKLVPLAKVGVMAFGVVVGLLGIFLFYAAIQADPEKAAGFGDAFAAIRQAAYGRVLIGLMGVGMLCYAVYNVIEAAYRVVMRAAEGSDIVTLAQAAKAKAGA